MRAWESKKSILPLASDALRPSRKWGPDGLCITSGSYGTSPKSAIFNSIYLMSMPSRYRLLLFVGFGLVLLDQAIKWIIQTHLLIHESIHITSFFNITHVRNKGAAFGLFSSAPDGFRELFFAVISLIAIAVVIILFVKTDQRQTMRCVSLSFILSGAVGNLIDRLRIKEVIDFIDVHVGSYHWPAFNVADSAITVGVIILALQIFFEEKGVKNRPANN
jgi:signal peptidase II